MVAVANPFEGQAMNPEQVSATSQVPVEALQTVPDAAGVWVIAPVAGVQESLVQTLLSSGLISVPLICLQE